MCKFSFFMLALICTCVSKTLDTLTFQITIMIIRINNFSKNPMTTKEYLHLGCTDCTYSKNI